MMQNHQEVMTVKPMKWTETCTKDLQQLSKASAAALLGNCSCTIQLKDNNAGFNKAVLDKAGAGMSFNHQQDQFDD
ncbi:hypothetical protein REH81_00485 [Vibrio rotiferianus]